MDIPEYLQGFFYTGQTPLVRIEYDPSWVLFSVIIAVVGSVVGLMIADLSKPIKNKLTQRSMQAAGAVTFGTTVWSMHFIGMLAVSIPVSMSYSPWVTLFSSFPAIIAAWFSIRWAASTGGGHAKRLLTALLIAFGIGMMHYSGMLAMKMDALLRFEVWDFVYSILIVLGLSYAGIWADEALRAKLEKNFAHLVGGVLLGLAITGMHYEAMKSVRIIAYPETMDAFASADRAYLGVIIFLGVVAAVGIGLSGSLLTKLHLNLRALKLSRAQMQTIITQSMNAVIVVNSENEIESCNNQVLVLFNTTNAKISGKPITKLLPTYIKPTDTESGVSDTDISGVTAEGTEIQLLMRCIKITQAEASQTIIYLMDVSDFRDVERELYHQATHDSLTGVFNRRHLEACAQHEYEYFLRSRRPLSALMFDLDHFKRINDTFGHDIGDLVLKGVAETTERVLRKSDLFFRAGGEEFVVLLPDTTRTNALFIGEKIRRQIAAEPVAIDTDTIKVTISVGIATIETELEGGVSELLRWADEAMYDSKHSGRNRCTHYDSLTAEKTAVC